MPNEMIIPLTNHLPAVSTLSNVITGMMTIVTNFETPQYYSISRCVKLDKATARYGADFWFEWMKGYIIDTPIGASWDYWRM
jgi:hypothetical protein